MNRGKKGVLLDNERSTEDMMEDIMVDTTEEKKEKMKEPHEELRTDKDKRAKHKEDYEKEKEAHKAEEEAMGIKYLRLMADFQNYKKRVDKEKSDIYAYANEKIVLELLDVIDNFERALAHQGEEGNPISDGMNMIYKQLKTVLEKSGLQEIDALGQEFDPNLHNAVMMEESEEYEPGKVTLVMQKGYFLNKKVIRHTMVRVAK